MADRSTATGTGGNLAVNGGDFYIAQGFQPDSQPRANVPGVPKAICDMPERLHAVDSPWLYRSGARG